MAPFEVHLQQRQRAATPSTFNGGSAAHTPDRSGTKTNLVAPSALITALGYVACSSMMMIVNKWALKLFPYPGTLMGLQFASSALVVRLLGMFGQLECEPLVWARARAFLLVPLVFEVAIFANIKLLQAATVETVIVFRTLVPIITSWADYAFMGREAPSTQSALGLGLVVLGALVYAAGSREGIRVDTWMWAACYLAVLAFEMVYVKHVLSSVPMGTWTRVYYNNALAMLFLPPVLYVGEEHKKLGEATIALFVSERCQLAVGLSCVIGLGISFTGFRFRALVTATTFTVVGVMNKIFTVLASLMLLSSNVGAQACVGLLICIAGGTLYRQSPPRQPGSSSRPQQPKELQPILAGQDSDDDEEAAAGPAQ